MSKHSGFSLIELMIVVLIIGVLAAIAIPNFVAMQDRAKEGSTKENMHTFQLAVEDYAVQHDGVYPTTAADATKRLPIMFVNPWTGNSDQSWGNGNAKDGILHPHGMVFYARDSTGYTITGMGMTAPLVLELNDGR